MDLIEPKLLKRLQNWHKRLCNIPDISSDDVPRSFISCFDNFVDEIDAQVMKHEARELMKDWIKIHASYTADAAVAEQSGETESGY